jgi:hypothetical protein
VAEDLEREIVEVSTRLGTLRREWREALEAAGHDTRLLPTAGLLLLAFLFQPVRTGVRRCP